MNIVIVDDDILVCNSLKTIVTSGNIDVMGIGHSYDDAISLYNKYKPDILLMDIRMGNDKTGLDAAQEILNNDANAKILFLTTFLDDEYILKAIRIGAKGYILKQDFENLIPALNAVYCNQSVFGSDITKKIPELVVKSANVSHKECNLDKKDIEIITLIAKGLSNKEISEKLFLSEGTIRNYISLIMEKLALKSRTQLVIYYYNNIK